MVKITNGQTILTVTNGAFRAFFKANGWRPVGASTAPTAVPAPAPTIAPEPELDEVLADEEDAVADDTEELEDEEAEDYSERPLSSLNKAELQEYAEQLGLDPEGMSKDDLRKAIKAKL